MTVYTEISVIRSSVKPIKSKIEAHREKDSKARETKEGSPSIKKESVKNNDIEREILTYNADGTIEQIALENRHLIDILG